MTTFNQVGAIMNFKLFYQTAFCLHINETVTFNLIAGRIRGFLFESEFCFSFLLLLFWVTFLLKQNRNSLFNPMPT